jgi:DNA repair exonuclease SbcCD ATPase subunit
MDVFNGGNLLTLGIVGIGFLLSRFLGKHNRNISLARDYGKHLKDELKNELKTYIEQKESNVRDYGVSLEADLKRAAILKESMEDEIENLAKNMQTLNAMGQRIDRYDALLNEMDTRTDRVEENLSRIQVESEFVEKLAETMGSVRLRLGEIDHNIAEMQNRIEKDTEQAVQKTSSAILQNIRDVVSDLKATAESVGVSVEGHREAIKQAEAERKQHLDSDMEIVNAALKRVTENAVSNSSKIEDELCREFTGAAQKRDEELRQMLGEKIADIENSVSRQIAEINDNIQSTKDNLEKHKEDWEKSVSGLDIRALDQRSRWQKMLEENDAAIEQYRQAQNEQMKNLQNVSSDAKELDAQLRIYIQTVKDKIETDFASFEEATKQKYGATSEEFNRDMGSIRNNLEKIEKELASLKEEASERLSGNLKSFEETFAADLLKRKENIQNLMNEWKTDLNKRFAELGENVETDCRKIENAASDSLQKKKDELDQHFDSEVDKIKTASDDLAKVMRERMERFEQAIQAGQAEITRGLEDARNDADDKIKTEIARFALQSAEKLTAHERKTESAIQESAANIESKIDRLNTIVEEAHKRGESTVAESEGLLNSVRGKFDELSGEIQNQKTEILTAMGEKIKNLEMSISDAEQQIKNFFGQTDLINKANDMKKDLTQKIEDINVEISKLELRRSELAGLETHFTKIKRTEEELNTKMEKFFLEQTRIEHMDNTFQRLLQTSQSVDEKLRQVGGADDLLQAVQLKLRKLDDTMKETEARYQRLEKKNEVLDATSDGIDRNFKSLQESERSAQQFIGDVQRVTAGLDDIRAQIENLAKENEKAQDTMEKIATLDTLLGEIERRMKEMQKARGWLADIETRMDEKNREIHQQAKLADKILNKHDDKIKTESEGSIPPGTREDVLRLKKMGWKVEEIAKSVKISIGAVELILETASRER